MLLMLIEEDSLMFIGAFTLLVLPLFLMVCVQLINNSSWKYTFIGKILVVLFYIVAIFAIGTALYLFSQIGDSAPTQQQLQLQ
jgi:hypothetical protein